MTLFNLLESGFAGRVETRAVEARATIYFPDSVPLNGVKELFQEIANRTGLSIDYRVRGGCRWKLTGNMARTKPYEPVGRSSFEAVKESNEPFLDGVRFDTSRGSEVEDYAPGTVRLWDDVRSAVDEILG